MVKSYLRYAPGASFGVVSSLQGNVVLDSSGKVALCPAVEDVLVWNIKQGIKIRHFSGEKEKEVTAIALSPEEDKVAVGYTTGMIKLFEFSTGTLLVSLAGHRSAVLSLSFNGEGSMLSSGSADTDIIVWDVVSQAGLYRLRGHKDAVTAVAFVDRFNYLISASKDTLLKCWDLSTQHCVQTVVGHRSEVWSMALCPERLRVVTGSSDAQLRVWAITTRGEERARRRRAKQEKEEEDKKEEKEEEEEEEEKEKKKREEEDKEEEEQEAGDASEVLLRSLGTLPRSLSDRVGRLCFTGDGAFLGCQAAGKGVEFYRLRSAAEAHKKRLRRLKRQREKEAKRARRQEKAEAAPVAEQVEVPSDSSRPGPEDSAEISASDEFEYYCIVRTSKKVRSLDVGRQSSRDGAFSALLSLADNSVELYGVEKSEQKKEKDGDGGDKDEEEDFDLHKKISHGLPAEAKRVQGIVLPGHRSDVRSVSFSQDGRMCLSVSSGAAKVWNTRTQQCIRTVPVPLGLCGTFLPGDQHFAVGTKEGLLLLVELGSGRELERRSAHRGAVWSLAVRPDGKGLASGSADHTVKFWEFDLVSQEGEGGGAGGRKDEEEEGEEGTRRRNGHGEKARIGHNDDNNNSSSSKPQGAGEESLRLGLVHTRTLQMADDVLCVKFSHHKNEPSKLLVAVALLDCTVKVFFDDTLKFFLSLYGHKLPVLSLDISDDNTLLISASADKNVKIWGLDFGDCHKSIFAHDDSVMAVAFVPGTHQFFTASKDRTLKHWDGDSYEEILTLRGHVGEVWSLAVTREGDRVLTGAHDRSLRLWERTEEQVFLEEEREKALESLFEAELEQGAEERAVALPQGEGEAGADGEEEVTQGQAEAQEVAAAGKRTLESVQAGERLVKALEVAEAEEQRLQEQISALWRARREREQAGQESASAGDQGLGEEHGEGQSEDDHEGESKNERKHSSKTSELPDLMELERRRESREAAAASVSAPAPGATALSLSASALASLRCKNPRLMFNSPTRWVLRALRSVPAAELEEALLVLPFSMLPALLKYLHRLLIEDLEAEKCAHCVFYLLKVYHNQIITSPSLMHVVQKLQDGCRGRLAARRDAVGFNMAGLRFLRASIEKRRQEKSFVGADNDSAFSVPAQAKRLRQR